MIDARPDFQMIIYPGWTSGPDGKVSPAVAPTQQIPPTFLLQAENDYAAHVEEFAGLFPGTEGCQDPGGVTCSIPREGTGLDCVRPSSLYRIGLRWPRPGCIPSISLGRLGRWGAPKAVQVVVSRVCQISRRVSARVKSTGPRTMPMGPKRAMPPSTESRMVVVWERR